MKNLNTFSTFSRVSRSKSAAVKNIDIDVADISGSEISVNSDIGHGDIDPALEWLFGVAVVNFAAFRVSLWRNLVITLAKKCTPSDVVSIEILLVLVNDVLTFIS